jgi:hypothetical protein
MVGAPRFELGTPQSPRLGANRHYTRERAEWSGRQSNGGRGRPSPGWCARRRLLPDPCPSSFEHGESDRAMAHSDLEPTIRMPGFLLLPWPGSRRKDDAGPATIAKHGWARVLDGHGVGLDPAPAVVPEFRI